MALSRQHKLIIISLVFYWAALFILAHIPIPQLVRQAEVSDKGLHFLAYLILFFLLASAINPNKKIDWRKTTTWWILLVVVLYGLCDELLQSCVRGRSCDAMDFVADLEGTLTGLIVLSIFTFWPACLIVTGVTIFGLTNIARANLADLLPGTNTAFHLFAYALFTLLWIRYLDSRCSMLDTRRVTRDPSLVTRDTCDERRATLRRRWLIVAAILPAGLLLAVKLGSLILGRSFAITDVIVSAVGIAAVVATIFMFRLYKNQISKIKTCPFDKLRASSERGTPPCGNPSRRMQD